MAAGIALLLGAGTARATVQYRFVPTSIALNGVSMGPTRVHNIDFSVTDAAFRAGHVSANVTQTYGPSSSCNVPGHCQGPNTGLVAPPFFRNTIDAALRPDGLVSGSFSSIRASEEFSLSGTGYLWSGLYASEAPYFSAEKPNQAIQCAGSISTGRGCTITGYFLIQAVTAAAQATAAQATPVPEPASAMLLAPVLLALTLITLAVRRRVLGEPTRPSAF